MKLPAKFDIKKPFARNLWANGYLKNVFMIYLKNTVSYG
jgi:hypothetical protein